MVLVGVGNALNDFNALNANPLVKKLALWGANFNTSYGITYAYYDGATQVFTDAALLSLAGGDASQGCQLWSERTPTTASKDACISAAS